MPPTRLLRSFVFTLYVCLTAFCGSAAVGSPLPRSTPEAQGIPSRVVLDWIQNLEERVDAVHSIMIVRHGHVIAEGWWAPYTASDPHMMFSLSKSFASTGIGLAVTEGKLSVDDTVLSFFPDEAPSAPSAQLQAMRVRDLLTMSTGQHEDTLRSFPYSSSESLVKTFLALPVAHKPGTHFVYNTPASFMLSAIVQKVTGQTLLDYLKPRLFAPLGIENPTWEASRLGVSMGGYGLSVRTEDIARFGQLYLQQGQWEGRSLLPASWVELATAKQTSNGSSPNSDWEQGYGFQFWRCRHGVYRGDGAHGQYCIVMPAYDTVIAITSGTRDMGAILNLTWDMLLPSLRAADDPLPAHPSAYRELQDKLQRLTLPPAAGTASLPKEMKTHLGRRYRAPVAEPPAGEFVVRPANPQLIESLLVHTDSAGQTSLRLAIEGQEQTFPLKPSGWSRPLPSSAVVRDINAAAISAAWTGPTTLTLKLVRYRTPFSATYRIEFLPNQLSVEMKEHLAPPTQATTLTIWEAEAPPASKR
ncbi:MAG TPA: serine hydrolase [Opitutaceae bacterium]|nr:serine hydrolase [Opitutaceae bacterium]